ncbi:PREDICTED: uncharacterized protein LOC109580424 isoform X1 [Amphimedon queenslandica]|uniref:Uncharacterized protein n=1 Tax=Amphimedon queenslandica TaxID=400682 RepID=A0AAN0IXB8_AMPQE|nr:PREDICTED: uncharacterized protein LOC109580424 isoform X1 [Amphimedon queenslandica]|eukprot:XP_019849093.1 PREDICTED: uncharacterized protein LOC109580424 isoform X1 [Amphimedon queenslandica]
MADLIEEPNCKRPHLGNTPTSQGTNEHDKFDFLKMTKLAANIKSLQESIQTKKHQINVLYTKLAQAKSESRQLRIMQFASDSNTQLNEYKQELESKMTELTHFHGNFRFSVEESCKLSFCLVDLIYPTILEISVVNKDMRAKISPSILPPLLTPVTTKSRDASGEYNMLATGKYIHFFNNVIAATNVRSSHFQRLSPIKTAAPNIEVTYCPEFVPPKSFLADCDSKELVTSILVDVIPQLFALLPSLKTEEAIKDAFIQTTCMCTDVHFDTLAVKGLKANKNTHFVRWLKVHYGNKFIIKDNECLTELPVTLHQSSRPDFCLFPKSNSFSAVSVSTQPEEDEDPEQISISSEEELEGVEEEEYSKKQKAQALANMVAVAGFLVTNAILNDKKFHKITIYGLQCCYIDDCASLMKLVLDFEKKASDLFEYKGTQRIGNQIARVSAIIEKESQL